MRSEHRQATGLAGRGSQCGALLIEVLISLIVVGIGVLGLTAMQARAISNQKDSFDRKTAAELMAQLNERMRANHIGFMTNAYSSRLLPTDTVGTAANCLATAPCSPAVLAQNDLVAWHTAIRQRLIDGGAVIAPVGASGALIGAGASSVRVTMIWHEAHPTPGADANCSAVSIADASYRCLIAEVFP